MTGGCLCGAVRIRAGRVGRATACHCTMCRKVSGHVWAAGVVQTEDLRIEGEVRWFRSSETVERGFCPTCGSALFFRPMGGDHVAVALGAFDGPTGLRLENHIFTSDKGDYYEIGDGLPQS